MRLTVLRALLSAAVVGSLTVLPSSGTALAAAPTETVLVLAPTVDGGVASIEASEAAAQGFAVELASPVQWAAKTAADFASYRALILGDPYCGSSDEAAAAEANAATWGPAVDGNTILVGTDPVYHAESGGESLTRKGVAFAVGQAGRTGAYISLSCYYHGTSPGTPVPLLDGIAPAGFTMTGVGCYNNAHIVATHPALDGLTDAALSDWGCSVHEAFDLWPADFTVLAIARDIGVSFTASDGSIGTPYILARGAGLRSIGLSLSPTTGTVDRGSAHSVSASLLQAGEPVAGRAIRFAVTAGPDLGVVGSCSSGAGCQTGADGLVAWTFTNGGVLGENAITAFADTNANGIADSGEPLATAVVTVSGANRPPVFVDPTPASGSTTSGDVGVPILFQISAVDPDGDQVEFVDISGVGGTATIGRVDSSNMFDVTWTPTAPGSYPVSVTISDRTPAVVSRVIVARSFSIAVRTPTGLTATPAIAEVAPTVAPYAGMVNGQPSFGVVVGGVWFRYLAAQLGTLPGQQAVAGKSVTFSAGGRQASATTGANGWAVLADTDMAVRAVQAGGYTASFGGDTLYRGSNTSAKRLGTIL